MLNKKRYGLFILDTNGPLCKDLLDDLEQARRQAEELAESEGRECFIFDLSCSEEVSRIVPRGSGETTKA